MKPELKFLFAETKGLKTDGTLEAVASTGALDRDREKIDPDAWKAGLEAFRKNSVILATHQHRLANGSSPVIGSARTIDIAAGQLSFSMSFAGTALGQEYKQLYQEGHMKAFSVGFIPRKGEYREERGIKTYVHTEVELLEISAVPVPSNPEALARMIAASYGTGGGGDGGESKPDFQKELSKLNQKIDDVLDLLSDLVPDTVNPKSTGGDPGPDADGAGDAGDEGGGSPAEAARREVGEIIGLLTATH